MPFPWTTAKPFPHGMIVGGVGVPLKPTEGGELVAQRSRRLDAVAPSTYDYGALDPYKERPFVMGRLEGGMGEAVQRSGTPVRYKAAKRVDCSIGGMRRLGPGFADVAFPGLATGESGEVASVRQFVVGIHVTASDFVALFALVRDHVYVQHPTTGAWSLSKDFGANARPQSAVDFKDDTGSRGLWVATNAGELWKYDGTTWTQATLPVGADAQYVARIGSELYVGYTDHVRVCRTGDPLLAAFWDGEIRVGERTTWVSGLGTVGGVLFIFKPDGVYTLNADASVNELFPELRARQSALTGRNATTWGDRLWFAAGDAFMRMDAGGSAEPVGPERLTEHGAGIRGRVTSAAGHNDWFLYAGLFDPETGESALLKYGTWVVSADGGYVVADAWHGALACWASKRITRMDVVMFDTDQIAARPGPTLWVGFADGTAAWTALPRAAPDPAGDPRCTFTTEEAYLDWPDHHAMSQADAKHFRAFAATGPRLDATHYVTVAYRIDDAGAYTDVGTALASSGATVKTQTAAAGALIRVREYLHGTATSTPEVESVVLLEQVRPALELESRVVAVCKNRAARRNGTIDPRTAEQVRAALQATAGPGPTETWFPDGSLQEVDYVDYGEAIPNPTARWGVEYEVPLTLVQWKTLTVYGTWDRAALMDWDEAAGYDWDSALRW